MTDSLRDSYAKPFDATAEAVHALDLIEGTLKAYASKVWWLEHGADLVTSVRRGIAEAVRLQALIDKTIEDMEQLRHELRREPDLA